MKTLKYTTSNEEMQKIKDALKTNSMGIGFSILFDITIEKKDQHNSTLILTPNDPEKEINPIEFFAFGIIVGRDYLKKNIIIFGPK
ncbi:hypothetical protein SAMN05421786_11525 [Chryseobacterium ureilyticum]|uniref:Uncharacterized protein n=1 Tax=Chryseobacterium ureilyticum TaxID=373668 RepID=A0A1N7QS04_9FLAO|nr:hypothetical protein [Chryseobacterium ureilyticum]SIT25544.1 hypothetical protein SAMN05421786_11525 [Chryseobacterium ureilyticum]